MHLANLSRFSRSMLLASSALLGIVLSASAVGTDITGAGSTFVYPILAKWSADYNTETGNQINYQSIGSGAGLTQIKAATVDFGASDMPMRSVDLAPLGLAQFPSVIGAVVPVVNIEGIQPGQLKFTGLVLARIFLGQIEKWNEPEIQALNPGAKLPDAPITVIHRSDGSGTTYNWADYLCKVNPAWRATVGEATSLKWPVGIGGNGNEGVAALVNQTQNSIGYVEYAYVKQKRMTYALVQNRAGNYVEPSVESFQAAAATAEWNKAHDFDLVITDAPGPNAYPITATTFILMYKTPKDAARAHAALDFFKWALEKGQTQADALDYVPLPPDLVKQIEAYWVTNIK